MKWVGIIIVSPLWGVLSSEFVVKGVLHILALFIAAAGLATGRVPRQDNLLSGAMSLVALLFNAGLFLGGRYLLARMGLGFSQAEAVVYWLCFVPSFLFLGIQVPMRLREFWEKAMVPGALARYIRERKANEAAASRS